MTECPKQTWIVVSRLANTTKTSQEAHSTKRSGAYQLCAHTVRSLERPLVQKVVVAPVPAFLVLLVCMVHIEESEMITCNSPPACNMEPAQTMYTDVSVHIYVIVGSNRRQYTAM